MYREGEGRERQSISWGGGKGVRRNGGEVRRGRREEWRDTKGKEETRKRRMGATRALEGSKDTLRRKGGK